MLIIYSIGFVLTLLISIWIMSDRKLYWMSDTDIAIIALSMSTVWFLTLPVMLLQEAISTIRQRRQ